jgi:DNA-directed RNA polymerase specialized sigma24 family protein
MSILRYRLAQSRQPCELPAPHVGPTSASIHQFHVDLERAMDRLPEVVRQTASALGWFSAVDAAEAVGCSRQTINIRKHQIRHALLAAGIESNYFVGGGSRP